MRIFHTTLLTLTLLAAGCTADDSEANDPAPGGPTPSVPTAGGSPAPKEVFSGSHDFSTGAAAGTPAGGATSEPFDVPSGFTRLTMTVTFSPASPAPAGAAAGVSITAGGLTCSIPDGPLTAPVTCEQDGKATSGENTVEYAGTGPLTATIAITAS